MNIDQFITKTKEYLSLKQHQTLQNLKIQVYGESIFIYKIIIELIKQYFSIWIILIFNALFIIINIRC